MSRTLNGFALLLSLLVSVAVKPAFAYEGGSLKNHGHTSSAGDGGLLSNLTLSGTQTVDGLRGNSTAITVDSMTFSGALNHQIMRYRRPRLVFNSTTQVDIETGTAGTAGLVTAVFPDGSVYNESTAANIRAVVTSTANWGNGTMSSGVRPTEQLTNNTWEAVYLVKSTATSNTSDFVVVYSTWLPIQANFSTLNGSGSAGSPFFGTNGYIYLGLVRNGDGGTAPIGILSFEQSGNYTVFTNGTTGTSSTSGAAGLLLATTASATSLTYTYASGTGTTQLPANIIGASWFGGRGGVNSYVVVANAAANVAQVQGPTEASSRRNAFQTPVVSARAGCSTATGSATSMDISIVSFTDGVLGVGANPQL